METMMERVEEEFAEKYLLEAAKCADWGQVLANGGPPCFHFEEDRRRFCLRAERWEGHGVMHKYSSLADLMANIFEQK